MKTIIEPIGSECAACETGRHLDHAMSCPRRVVAAPAIVATMASGHGHVAIVVAITLAIALAVAICVATVLAIAATLVVANV